MKKLILTLLVAIQFNLNSQIISKNNKELISALAGIMVFKSFNFHDLTKQFIKKELCTEDNIVSSITNIYEQNIDSYIGTPMIGLNITSHSYSPNKFAFYLLSSKLFAGLSSYYLTSKFLNNF